MGSLNTNGTTITQQANTIRRLGGAFTDSADRVETRTVSSPNNTLFSQETPNEDLVQTSVYKRDDTIKLANSKTDELVERVYNTGV